MDRNVFLSLLSMDSYNRIYGRRVSFDSRSDGAIQIGDATVQPTNGRILAGWISNGFFASDYVIGDAPRVGGFSNGNRIISYRGTDLVSEDLGNYGIGAGDPYNAAHISFVPSCLCVRIFSDSKHTVAG